MAVEKQDNLVINDQFHGLKRFFILTAPSITVVIYLKNHIVTSLKIKTLFKKSAKSP